LAFDIFFDWIPDQVGNDGEVMRFRNRPAASGLFRNDILSVYRLFARPVFDSEVAHFGGDSAEPDSRRACRRVYCLL